MVMPHSYAHLLIGDTSTTYYTDVATRVTMLRSDFTLLHRYIGLPRSLFPAPSLKPIRYDLVPFPCMIRSGAVFLCDVIG